LLWQSCSTASQYASGSMTQLSCSELYKIDQWTLETWLYWTTAESLAPVSFGCARIIVRI
jgi:hypothetical protein